MLMKIQKIRLIDETDIGVFYDTPIYPKEILAKQEQIIDRINLLSEMENKRKEKP